MSLRLRCIRTQTLIEDFYIQFQVIYHSAVLSKLNGIVISLTLRLIKRRGTTYLLIRSSSIRLNL